MAKLYSYLSMIPRIRPVKAAPKVWNYLRYRTQQRQARFSVTRSTPQIASLLLTKRCNMSCDFCNVASFLHDKKTKWQALEGDLERVQRIFANPLFAKCLLVDILGGEPMLVKDLEKIVAWLTDQGHLTNITTNGLNLVKRIEGLKKAGVSRISVSIYEENRQALERDLPSINKVFRVHTTMILFRKDVEEAPDMLVERAKFVRDSGCLDVRFWMYRPIGETADTGELVYEDSPAFVALKERIDREMPGFCFWPVPMKKGPIKKLCPQLWQRVGCDMSGNMGICCGTDTLLSGPDGNLFQGAPDKIFNHPMMVEIREKLLDPESEPPEICKNCNLLGDPGW